MNITFPFVFKLALNMSLWRGDETQRWCSCHKVKALRFVAHEQMASIGNIKGMYHRSWAHCSAAPQSHLSVWGVSAADLEEPSWAAFWGAKWGTHCEHIYCSSFTCCIEFQLYLESMNSLLWIQTCLCSETHPGDESGKILFSEAVMWLTMASRSSMCSTLKDKVCLSVSNTICNTHITYLITICKNTQGAVISSVFLYLCEAVNVDGANLQVAECAFHLHTFTYKCMWKHKMHMYTHQHLILTFTTELFQNTFTHWKYQSTTAILLTFYLQEIHPHLANEIGLLYNTIGYYNDSVRVMRQLSEPGLAH